MRRAMSVGSCIGGAAVGYVLVVRGALTLDSDSAVASARWDRCA